MIPIQFSQAQIVCLKAKWCYLGTLYHKLTLSTLRADSVSLIAVSPFVSKAASQPLDGALYRYCAIQVLIFH